MYRNHHFDNFWPSLIDFMIYDHETGITHKSVSTYFQCGAVYWVDVFISPSSLLTGVKIPWGWYWQSVLISQWILASPPLCYLIQWRRQKSHVTWAATHVVLSQEIFPWKGFDFMLQFNLYHLPIALSQTCSHSIPHQIDLFQIFQF